MLFFVKINNYTLLSIVSSPFNSLADRKKCTSKPCLTYWRNSCSVEILNVEIVCISVGSAMMEYRTIGVALHLYNTGTIQTPISFYSNVRCWNVHEHRTFNYSIGKKRNKEHFRWIRYQPKWRDNEKKMDHMAHLISETMCTCTFANSIEYFRKIRFRRYRLPPTLKRFHRWNKRKN